MFKIQNTVSRCVTTFDIERARELKQVISNTYYNMWYVYLFILFVFVVPYIYLLYLMCICCTMCVLLFLL